MERRPEHERIQIADKLKGTRKPKRQSSLWQWPRLEYGSIGSATLVSKDGRVRWSTVVDTSNNARWLPLGKPVKVFPETRSAQVDVREHSARQRAEKGLQHLRAYFPDADVPGEMLGDTLEADAKETRHLQAFDPFLGNMLEIIQDQSKYAVVFPMGELRRELNISYFISDKSGNMVFNPTGSPSFVFETPILHITSALGPSQRVPSPTSTLLIRTHTSSSLLRLECPKPTRELDITRSEVGDIPIADSRILGSGPDIVVVNRSGNVFKCNTYHDGKAMELIGSYEVSNDDAFWQLGVTARSDECFVASCKVVKHIDMRSASSAAEIFTLDHPSALVTSFESPTDDYISRITTTGDVIWLDDRFRGRPLLSFKHYRSFDRTLRVLTADLSGSMFLSYLAEEASISLLTSRRNGLVTLYDVSKGTDGLLHCNSRPSCLPHPEPMSTAYDGHALAAFPSDVKLSFLRLCQRGSVHRQYIRVAQLDEDQPGSIQENHVTHQWDEDVLTLEKQVNGLQTDFGPAGGRHFVEVNFRGAYEKICAIGDDIHEDVDRSTPRDTLARLPDAWQNIKQTADSMLTTLDVISGTEDGDKSFLHPNFQGRSNVNSKQVFDALMHGHLGIQKLAGLARWHYCIQDTSIPSLGYRSASCAALHEYLKELNLVSGVEEHDVSVRRETEAREQLVVDLALSKDVYSAQPLAQPHSFAVSEGAPNTTTRPAASFYSEEPPEIKFGYFHPTRKAGADHYAGKEQDGRPDFSSPLGVRLLLAEWELGTDPKSYTYRDPYGVADMDTQPTPEYRKSPVAPQMAQKKQTVQQRPPPVVAAATQPPAVHVAECTPAMAQSQPVRPEPSFDTDLHGQMTSTQVLPGVFGGRPGAGGKKSVKKRLGGF